jgi:uncharacterized protein (TIGR03084 family)
VCISVVCISLVCISIVCISVTSVDEILIDPSQNQTCQLHYGSWVPENPANPVEAAPEVAAPVVNPMEAICDDLSAETADLLRIIIPLSPAQWDSSTPADGWSIRDTISHLAYFDETGNLAATDPEAFAASAKELMAAADPMEPSLGRGRAKSTNDVLNWFISARTAMTANFRTLDPKARLPWYGPAMGAMSFGTARLMETWAHGQDIADTLGVTRKPTDRLRHVAHIGVRARAFSYATNRRETPDGDIKVVLTGPNGDRWAWNDALDDTNVVKGSALDFCLAVTQRRHLADTGLVVTGPLAQDWMGIAQAFAGAPGTGREPGQFAH